MVSFAPLIKVILSHAATPVMIGKLIIPADGIITLIVPSGGVPPHQFEPVFQSLFVAPLQVPGIQVVEVIFNNPVAEDPK